MLLCHCHELEEEERGACCCCQDEEDGEDTFSIIFIVVVIMSLSLHEVGKALSLSLHVREGERGPGHWVNCVM